jgi:hypothetical protein
MNELEPASKYHGLKTTGKMDSHNTNKKFIM